MSSAVASSPVVVGRYALYGDIASGGMATVHIGRLLGPVGFSRTVAIKRLHPNFSKDPEFVSMFLDEARLAARIRHPNVVSILDVVAMNSELLLVMDYIAGESLARLLLLEQRRGNRVPLDIVAKIMTEVLSGLHAAHEVTSDRGMHLGVVHRDVSPQNILVGQDGISHLIDFGVAKAAGRMHTTQNGQIKGKLAYMAPEQIVSEDVDRRVDIYASGIVLWEALTGRRAYKGADPQIMFEVLASNLPPPSEIVPGISPALDALVMKALAREPAGRFATALEMSDAIEALVRPATSREVARWVEQIAADSLQKRAQVLADVEGVTQVSSRYEAPPLDDDPHPELPQARFAAFAPSPQVPEDQLPTRFLPRNEPVSGDLQQSAAEQTVVPSVIVTGKGPETPFDATTSRLDRPKKTISSVPRGVWFLPLGVVLGAVIVWFSGQSSADSSGAALSVPSSSVSAAHPSASASSLLVPSVAPAVSSSVSQQPPPPATTTTRPSVPRGAPGDTKKNRLKNRGW